MEYILYIIVAAIAAWLGWHVRGFVFLASISENPERTIKMLEQIKRINAAGSQEELDELERDGIEIEPELVGAMWYAYSKEDGKFLGQGPSLDDAIKQAVERFPGTKFWYKQNEQSSQSA